MSTEKKIDNFKKKISKLTEKLTEEIYGICEGLDYKDSSVFSYNIDRLKQFNDGVQEYKLP